MENLGKKEDEQEESEKTNGSDQPKVNPAQRFPERFANELTEDEIVDRTIESFQLFRETEDLVKKAQQRKEQEKQEQFELRSGELRTWQSYITRDPAPYLSLFGHKIPFFSEILRLCDLDHIYNPKSFRLPPICGILVNETVYRRLGGKAIIQAFRGKAFVDGKRRYKFSQFVSQEDKVKLINFIKEVCEMTKTFKRGDVYEFRKAYAIRYNVEGFQYRIGD